MTRDLPLPPEPSERDPWRRAPVGELQEQLLPRWFVVLAVVMVPIALVVLILAFVVSGSTEIPVAERRPPPADGLTNDVGDFNVGTSKPVETNACPALSGILVAGSERDRAILVQGLRTLCGVELPAAGREALSSFVAAGGFVRFAQFEATGVDSTAQVEADPRTILVNNKFTLTDPKWTAPVVAHDVVMLAGDPAQAETALAARQVEDAVCDQLIGDDDPSRGCVDAATLLALDDPIAALRDAGYR